MTAVKLRNQWRCWQIVMHTTNGRPVRLALPSCKKQRSNVKPPAARDRHYRDGSDVRVN